MSAPKLEVTEDILDRVVYGMENQKEALYLDPGDGQLCEKGPDRKPLIPMPEWTPTDGFRLMDSFTATLPDTPFRRNLSDILHSGTGVFRRFKDALRERPGTEGIWRRYKKREMRKVALSWLSRWSEALTLENLGPEPEDWGELSLAEFSYREAGEGDVPFLDESKRAAEDEIGGCMPIEGSGGWIAEAPGDLPVGCVFVHRPVGGRPDILIGGVYVLPDFRGLGIGRMLTEVALEEAGGAGDIRLGTGMVGDATAKWLESLGFAPVYTLWRRTGR